LVDLFFKIKIILKNKLPFALPDWFELNLWFVMELAFVVLELFKWK